MFCLKVINVFKSNCVSHLLLLFFFLFFSRGGTCLCSLTQLTRVSPLAVWRKMPGPSVTLSQRALSCLWLSLSPKTSAFTVSMHDPDSHTFSPWWFSAQHGPTNLKDLILKIFTCHKYVSVYPHSMHIVNRNMIDQTHRMM